MIIFFILVSSFVNCLSMDHEIYETNNAWLKAVNNGDIYRQKLFLIKLRHLQALQKNPLKNELDNNVDREITKTEIEK
jgi:hypothetical protein